MTTLHIAPDNSAYVQTKLNNTLLGPVNDATVTAEINNMDDTNLLPSFALDYVAASSGIYRTTIAPVVGLTVGTFYKVVIDVLGSDGLIGKWECTIKASKLGC